MKVMSKSWLIGFTEAEGNFYLVNKDPQQLEHVFKISQKLEYIVLKAIAMILQVKVTTNTTNYNLVVTDSKDIDNIIKYYLKKIKGIKALEYRIWARSFTKRKKDYIYMLNIKNLIGNIRQE